MKKLTLLGMAAMLLGVAASTSACSQEKAISLWVGNEEGVVSFYQGKCKEFLEANPEFPYKIKITGTDMGSIAGTILKDPSSCADIYSVAHDNVGKLAQNGSASAITDAELKAQVEADNSESFVKVSKSTVAGNEFLFAVPYISQALFLMYDTRYVTPEQAGSFEGLKEAAVAASATLGADVKAVECPGTDGYNFSFPLLSRNNETKETSFKIYEDGTIFNGTTYVQGDDEVAFAKWINNYFHDKNGFRFPTDAGWTLDIQNHNAISFIGGAWHRASFASAVGESNLGLAMLPTFTLTNETAFGTATSGTTYRAGTFADCKVMMINSKIDRDKYDYAQQIIKYLSSKDVQNDAFAKVGIVPSYSSFAKNIDAIKAANPGISQSVIDQAVAQTSMTEYAIPQPFVDARLNNFYYQMGAPAVYQALVEANNLTDRQVQEGLYKLQYIWQNGKAAETVPDVLPVADTCIYERP